MKPAIILYVPVLHQGYIKLFDKYSDSVDDIWILGGELIKELTYLEPEIRAIDPKIMRTLIESLGKFKNVNILEKVLVSSLQNTPIITVNEKISERLIKKYFESSKVTLDTIFLRWDEANVISAVVPKEVSSSKDSFDQQMIKRASDQAPKSSDWWRQVGAVIVKDGQILLETHNQHVPSEQMPYAEGDPRDFVQAGTHSELSTALHCEQALVAEAANQGLPLNGTDLYVTVFPCPVCAKLVAYSGIKRCFFSTGHASLDSERILKSKNVLLIQVS